MELDLINFDALASAEAAGDITPDELAALQAAPDRWVEALHGLLAETEESLAAVRRSTRDERDQALADLTEERHRLIDALVRLGDGTAIALREREERAAQQERQVEAVDDGAPQPPVLQATWGNGVVVVWAGSRSSPPADQEELRRLLDEAGGAAVDWSPQPGVPLPSGEKAPALGAPMSAALGWLVGVGSGQLAADAGPSTRWLGEVATWGTELVAQGRMIPSLGRVRQGKGSTAQYAVRWAPAVVDGRRLRDLASRMPGAVGALDPAAQAEQVCRSVLGAVVDAVCRTGASRLVTPATAPVARSHRDVSEALLAGLDGTPFTTSVRPAATIARDLAQWAGPVTGRGTVGLRIHLDPPEEDGGWLLSVTATGVAQQPLPVERALAEASRTKTRKLETQLARLERLLPALRRATGRRGQVVLDGEEAWDLMTRTGATLVMAGFDVRVPTASRRRPAPRLQLRADPRPGLSQVGANQLSRVQWSVLVDDVELDAAAVARLSAQARPMVRAKGQWVELDRADLDAAAEALAERAQTTELSGAAILRHAVGLEEHTLGGPVAVQGSGWAVDLVRGASEGPPVPLSAPEGFVGTLRSYQAEARGWLAFLDRGGLGGCLAMDMGLGKTPTGLAHILATRGDGPSLVIAPPAVLGNWAAEAKRFTPELAVHVHHGAARAGAEEVGDVVAGADVVLTTYGTAVRDVDALADVEWHRIVVDEAQAIKNTASDTAQQLRRLSARSKLALTGTPIENGLGDLWSILDFTNPGLVGPRAAFIQQLSERENGQRASGEAALRALNGLLVFRRTKTEPEIAAELPDKIDEVDHCGMTSEQVGLYQAVLDDLLNVGIAVDDTTTRKGNVLAAITALKQICNHPAAYLDGDRGPLEGRSGKLARLNELVDAVFEAGERMLIFTHFARWGERLADYLSERTGLAIPCYHGGLARGARDRMVRDFQEGTGPGALVLSIKAGGSGLNLSAANHVVLYDRWWNPAVEDQARDRAWRIGQQNMVISHRLICPGTVDERVEEVVAGKRRIADLTLPASSSLGDLDADQLRSALGIRPDAIVDDAPASYQRDEEEPAA
jgi:hypothetical protein